MHREVDTLTLCGCYWTTVPTQMLATTLESLHCTLQQPKVTSRFLRYCSSALRMSTPGRRTEILHWSLHRGVDTLTLCCCYWTTLRTRMRATTLEPLHCTLRQPTVMSRFL